MVRSWFGERAHRGVKEGVAHVQAEQNTIETSKCGGTTMVRPSKKTVNQREVEEVQAFNSRVERRT